MLVRKQSKDSSLINKKKLFVLSLSSMLGVGIFLKSKTLIELSNGSLTALLALFAFSLVLIVSMGWIFTKLVEKHSKSSRSFIEWVEEHCSSACKSWALKYTRDWAHPISILSTSIFLLKWINSDSFLWVWESSMCALFIGAIVLSLNILSLRLALLLQKFLSLSIFLALAYLSGFAIHSIISSGSNSAESPQSGSHTLSGLNSLGSWTIMLSGLPAIFFMYDGFYSVLSLREKVREKNSFKGVISLSFLTITLLYMLIVSLILFAEPNTGDFLKLSGLIDKNFKDVLIVLIFLTFLSSLNISAMFAQNQMFELHYKYNFRELNSLRWSFLNRGKNLLNFRFESKLAIWMHLMKKMVILGFLISFFSQMIYWVSGNNNIFGVFNDIFAEINSLIIFLLLGKVIWDSRQGNKLKCLISLTIFIAFGYYLLNSLVSIFILRADHSEQNTSIWTSLLKFLIPIFLLFCSSFHWIKYRLSQLKHLPLKTLKFNRLNQEYSLLRYSST